MLHKKISLLWLPVSAISASALTFFLTKALIFEQTDHDNDLLNVNAQQCRYNIHRIKTKEYKFTKPLLFVEPNCESPELNNIKMELNNIINSHKQVGNINSASIYLRVFSQAQWTCINSSELYSPGSLLKVPELIAFFKLNQKAPGLFSRKIKYDAVIKDNRHIAFNAKQIIPGHEYTVKELLEYMIVYSDNQATLLLNSIIDKDVFNSVFTDIGLKVPDYSSKDYPMNTRDYSIFLIELFNGTYLPFNESEECLKLLSQSVFKEGMMRNLPDAISVAHKFGESGPTTEPNFSESAIIYAGNNCYLLTVMTKGKDMKKLPLVVS